MNSRMQNNMNGMNMQNFMSQLQNFMKNPSQAILQSGIGIPKEYISDPNKAIQFLMDSGRISQQQYHQARMMANQIKNKLS